MAHCYRIMTNKIGYGTSCVKDKIPTQREAEDLMKVLKATSPEKPFFIQEYEEARTHHE